MSRIEINSTLYSQRTVLDEKARFNEPYPFFGQIVLFPKLNPGIEVPIQFYQDDELVFSYVIKDNKKISFEDFLFTKVCVSPDHVGQVDVILNGSKIDEII